jgi:hypothetical protein
MAVQVQALLARMGKVSALPFLCCCLATFFATRIYCQTTSSPPPLLHVDLKFIVSILKTEATYYSETSVSITTRTATELRRLRRNRRTAAKFSFRNRHKPVPHDVSLVGSQSCSIRVRRRCFSDFCHMASVAMLI